MMTSENWPEYLKEQTYLDIMEEVLRFIEEHYKEPEIKGF